jgi:hypothetical protein
VGDFKDRERGERESLDDVKKNMTIMLKWILEKLISEI